MPNDSQWISVPESTTAIDIKTDNNPINNIANTIDTNAIQVAFLVGWYDNELYLNLIWINKKSH